MSADRNGLQVLDRTECLSLLRTATIGRVGISSDALPVILPVNFRLVGDEIVIRTAAGTKLDAAARNEVVAFETDDIEPVAHSGWSVMVTGLARMVTDERELARIEAAHLPRWAPRGDEHVIAISTRMISGRRLVQGLGVRGAPMAAFRDSPDARRWEAPINPSARAT